MQVEGESKPAPDLKTVGRPRLSSTGHVYAGLSDEEVEVRSGNTAPAACIVQSTRDKCITVVTPTSTCIYLRSSAGAMRISGLGVMGDVWHR